MKRPFLVAALLSVTWLAGCASYTALSPDERGSLERELVRPDPAYLRLSFYVTPFFGDAGKKYLSPYPPDEVDLLETPDGHVIPPGKVERILPAGTRVRIVKLEFPTSYDVTTRMPYTPRTQPWVYLSVDGEANEQPLIVVLKPGSKTREEVRADLEQYLVREDPAPRLAAYSAAVREAVKEKRVVLDMPTDALESAWGFPERKDITYQETSRREIWSYPGHARKAFVTDGRVTKTEGDGTNG